jgi:hypothetical protein
VTVVLERWLVAAGALAACRRPSPSTRIEPAAVPLLDGWAASIGGRDRLAARHAVHTKGTWNDGRTTGTYEDWVTDRGQARHEYEQRDVRMTEVLDGTHGWAADVNGVVLELDGPTLDRARTRVFLQSLAPLLPDRLAGDVTLVAPDTLRLVAEGSHVPIDVAFDPTTHRPRSWVWTVEGVKTTTELDDWREVDGIAMPFSETVTGEGSETRHALVIDDAVGSFTPLVDRDDDVRFLAPSPISVPIDIAEDGEVTLEASINGAPLATFILDSGAPTMLDPSRLPAADLHAVGGVQFNGENGAGNAAFAEGVSIELPGLVIGKHTLLTLSMAASYPKEDKRIAGILGTDLFDRVVVQIDYSGKRLRIFDASTYVHPAGGSVVPFYLAERTPVIQGSLELPDHTTVPTLFLVDSGCLCDVVATAAFAARTHLADELVDHVRKGPGFDVRRAPGLVVGQTRIEVPEVGLPLSSHKVLFDSGDYDAYFGAALLSRYRVTFDYRRKQLWFDGL